MSGLVAGALLLAGCDTATDDTAATVTAKRVTELPADPNTSIGASGRPTGATGRFTLYSLRDGAVVANTDSATTKWDVGFRSSTIIANRNTGSQGGLLVRVGAFADLAEAPDTAYGAQATLAQWADYNSATASVTPKAGRVLAVRTADGKYAKLSIVSYYKGQTPSTDPTASRYYTFDYALQSNGTRRFE